MKKPISEKLAKGLKIGTAVVLAAGVIAVFFANKVPLKKADIIESTDIISQISTETSQKDVLITDNSTPFTETSELPVSVTESVPENGLINIVSPQ